MKPDTTPLLSRRSVLLSAAGSAALVACGGGGTDAPSSAPTVTPTEATTDTGPTARILGVGTGGTGRISYVEAAFAAVQPLTVGNVTVDTTGATIVDGAGLPVPQHELELGMRARVTGGPIAAGHLHATSIEVDAQLIGPARWLDANHLVVLGQPVLLTSGTVRATTVQDASLRVWGELDPERGLVVATRIDTQTAAGPMLRGVVSAIDPAQHTVSVGTLVLHLASPLPTDVVAGARIRAQLGAQLAANDWACPQLRADATRPPEGADTELAGRVADLSVLADGPHFSLNGVAVDASQARITNPSALVPGAHAEVQGRMRNGVLVARTLELEAPEPVELSGRVTRLDPLTQTLTVNGRSVRWNASTVFAGRLATSLRVGREVEIRALPDASGSALLARRIDVH